jgi:excisionase family DNA binding protein
MLKKVNDLIDVDKVCLLTGFSKHTIYKLTSTNQIPFYKRKGGRKIFFSIDEIEKWMRGEINSTSKKLKVMKRKYDSHSINETSLLDLRERVRIFLNTLDADVSVISVCYMVREEAGYTAIITLCTETD